MRFRIGTKIQLISLVAVALLFAACGSVPKKPIQAKEDWSGHSPVGESYFDGNRAPASMSPPIDLGPDKIALDPIYMRTKADYHFALAETYGYSGDPQRAIEEFKLAAVYDPNSPVVRLKLAVEYVKKGMISEGMVQAEEAIKLDPNYSDARLLLGGIYAAIKLYDKSEEQYRSVIKNTPQNKEAYLYLGALLTEQKRYKEAIEIFMQPLKDPEYESKHLPHYYVGKVYTEKGDFKQAEASFLKSLSFKPDYTEGVIALGNLYENNKKRDKMLKLYASFQDKHGPSDRVAEHLSRVYLEDEKYEEAYKQLEIVVGVDPENLNAKVKMALIKIEMKDFPVAIKRLKEILADAPDSDKIRFFLGAVYEEVKDNPAAIEQFSMIDPTSSYYPEAVIHASYLQKTSGDLNAAISTIEKAVELRPDSPQFYPLYASYLDDSRQYQKAVKVLEGAIARFPPNDQLHFFLGSMYDKVKKKPETIVNMKKAIELNPDHVQALNYLAYTLAEMGESLDEAYDLAKRAIKLKPEDAYIQDTLGWIYFKRGEYAEAVKMLETAFKTKSDESVIAEHLGDAYYKHRLPIKAMEMYKRAKRLETDEENIRKLESKITAIERAQEGPRSPASLH